MKVSYWAGCALITTALLANVLPALAKPNLSDITGPNVSDITGPNVSDITGPNVSDNTGTHTSAPQTYTQAEAGRLADDIGAAYAACGGGDCPELWSLIEQASLLLGEPATVAAE